MTLDLLLTQDQGSSIVDGINHLRNLLLSIDLVLGEQRLCDHAEYVEAWHNYWDDIDSGLNCYDAIGNMRADYGGVARKQPIPEINGIYNEKIEYMLSLIQQSIESEYEG